MFDFHEKRRLRHIVYSMPVLALLVVVVGWLGYNVWGVYVKVRETDAKKEQRAAALAEIEERQTALEEEIDRLNSEVGIEAEIREKFDVAKEGEHVIVIVDPPVAEEDNAEENDRGFFSRVLNFFGF